MGDPNADISEATNNDLEDYGYDQFIRYQAEERLNIQLAPQSQVFPQQKFLANDLLRRVKYVQGERFKTFKKLDFQVRLHKNKSIFA